MPKRYAILLLFFSGIFLSAFSQIKETVKTEISAGDSINIRLIHAFPDSFPEVTLTFESTFQPTDEPFWQLKQEEVRVLENGKATEIVEFGLLSEQVPVNLMMVLDHSGSMASDAYYFNFPTWEWKYNPEINCPLKQAKKSLISFAKAFDNPKDAVGVVSFESVVSGVLSPTQDMEALQKFVDDVEPGESTAFYDGVEAARQELMQKEGLRVIIALTDGQDNASSTHLNSLTADCRDDDIPVYTIGLGDAREHSLKRLAHETGGDFFRAETGADLGAVYDLISRRIKAVYQLRYRSQDLLTLDSYRSIELQFDIDSIYQESEPFKMYLPGQIRDQLQAKIEADRNRALLTNLGIGGGVIATMLAIGIFWVRRRKRPNAVNFPLTASPNPSTGPVKLSYALPQTGINGFVELLDLQGRPLQQIEVGGDSTEKLLDLSGYAKGTYLIRLSQGGQAAEPVRVILN